MNRNNCWEVKQCGREPGGAKIEQLGVCPAAMPNKYDGVNKGAYGGRFCWVISGTFCGGKPQGTFAKKLGDCLKCPFLQQVNCDEGRFFILTPNQATEHKAIEAYNSAIRLCEKQE